jgi:hypothetical protein
MPAVALDAQVGARQSLRDQMLEFFSGHGQFF